MILKAGEILMIEYGSYSDKGWSGPFKVLKEFDQKEKSVEFLRQYKKNKKKNDWDKPSHYDFIAWLAANLIIEDFGATQWYVGDFYFEPNIGGKEMSAKEVEKEMESGE